MKLYCSKCGKEVDDQDEFCKSCGFPLKEKEIENKDENNKMLMIPLILGIIGIIVGIVEGLSCPMLFGFDSIIIEIVMSIVGGLLGIFLFKYKSEYLLSGIEFIITGLIMVFAISNMAIIGCVIFIAAGITSIVIFRKFSVENKILITFPIVTVIIPLLIIILLAGASAVVESNLSNQVSISNVENSISYSYGYYDGSLEGDIHLNTSFDYIEMDIEYYDEQGTVLYSGWVWHEVNADSGKTYHFTSTYFDEKEPVKAQITLKDSSIDDEAFYIQNVTLV